MVNKTTKSALRQRRQKRVRAKVKGTSSRPRLCVYKSLNNIYAQIIDDESQKTLVSTSTLNSCVKIKASNLEAAKEVGTEIAKAAILKNITEVVFDRNGYLYHGKVKALAEEARKQGLKF